MENIDFDIAVCGGGPAGTCAAIAAARMGYKTILVERHGSLGGALTNMGVAPMMTFHAWGKQPIKGIADEIISLLKAEGFSPGHISDTTGYVETVTPFNIEAMRYALERKTLEAGVTLLYHAQVDNIVKKDDKITAISVCHKGGRTSINAKVFIDATGDADIAVLAGCPTVKGREKDGLTQPMTKNILLGNVDREAIIEYMANHPEDFRTLEGGRGMIEKAERLSVCGFYSKLEEAKRNGDFTIQRETVLFFEMNEKGYVNVNTSRLIGYDMFDPFAMSRAEIEGRRQAFEIHRFLKKYIPGFKDCVILPASDWMGIRESRRIKGEYIVTSDDLLKETRFEDAIAESGYPIDIHNPDGAGNIDIKLRKGATYTVPYRSLIAKGVTNLLVCGRCLSATHEAAAALRVTPTAMATGEAAGVAAALASKSKDVDTMKVDVQVLKENISLN
ncbi:MAG: FAD-dependent oxidoreductase [Fibrobacteres bacterium]|nr:FAD-dependent oxidoreductase [Fibrobacterota bacterium]